MHRPDYVSLQVANAIAQETDRIALPLTHTRAEGPGFGALFAEVRRDVTVFIAEGSQSQAGSVARVPSLSAEGQARLANLQGKEADALPAVARSQQQQFIESIAPWARQAADRLGVEPEMVAAHAALESGWGQRPLRDAEGGSTNNLFGMKAGANWNGAVASALTTEFASGVSSKRTELFRSYANPGQAFGDYTEMLLGNSRFGAALNSGSDAEAFARGLARGSYATDPNYADKLERVTRQVREIGLPLKD